MTRDTANWYGEDGEWVRGLNDRLRERPTFGPEPTDDDRYHDGDPGDADDPPWLDMSDDREDEL